MCSPPIYVIGTEVPPPGGIPSGEDAVPISEVEDLLETVSCCAAAFRAAGIEDAWERTCAVVAQPGVEFGDHEVHAYDRVAAEPLCRAAHGLANIVLEGHSTDYQTPQALRQLVEDGVAVLKVGPALTFALRESLFALESIERELAGGRRRLRSLSATLDRAMMDDPVHWAGYYAGTDSEQRLARRFSYSDRARYYWFDPAARSAVEELLRDLERIPIPLTLLSQFLPIQYRAVREGRLAPRPAELLRAGVRAVLRGYSGAVQGDGQAVSAPEGRALSRRHEPGT
jgi:D-tagatose-1,6-bisphosphate aldolase subunit GatZ/KbaZ